MPLSSPDSLRSLLSLEAACNDAPYGLLVLDERLIIRYVNTIAASFFGLSPTSMTGQPLFGLVPEAEPAIRPLMQHTLLTGEARRVAELPFPMPERLDEGILYWNGTFSPVRDGNQIVGVLCHFSEVTKQVASKRAEQKNAAELDAVFNTITDGLAIINAKGEIARVNPAGERILRGPTPKELPLSDASKFYTVRDAETLEPMPSEKMASLRALRGETVIGQEQVLRDGTGTDIVISINAAPLRGSEPGTGGGAIALFRDITHLKRLQAETAAAHARARRIAQTLQASLMPSLPLAFDQYTMGLAFQAAWVEEADVGGDLLDFFTTHNGSRAHIVIADVSGKGLLAARRTAQIKYTIKALAFAGLDLRPIVAALNDAIVDDAEFDGFVTLFYAVFSLPARVLKFVNAGHEPGLLWEGRKQRIRTLTPTGLPLGVLHTQAGASWTANRTLLRPSDGLLLYTDGFTEAPQQGTRRLLGEEQARMLFAEAVRLPDGPAGVSFILAAIQAHAGPRLRDDLALLLLRGNQVAPG